LHFDFLGVAVYLASATTFWAPSFMPLATLNSTRTLYAGFQPARRAAETAALRHRASRTTLSAPSFMPFATVNSARTR